MVDPLELFPLHLVVVGETVWLVDGFQPVAAVIGPDGDVLDVVGWASVDEPAAPELGPVPWTVMADPTGDGVWVQQRPGRPVARVDRSGVRASSGRSSKAPPVDIASDVVGSWFEVADRSDDHNQFWYDPNPRWVQIEGVPLGERVCVFGYDRSTRGRDRHTVLAAHEPLTLRQLATWDLGPGHVIDSCLVGGELWLLFVGPTPGARRGSFSVIATDGLSLPRAVVAPLPPIDISSRRWPLIAMDAQEAAEHTQALVHRVERWEPDDLDVYAGRPRVGDQGWLPAEVDGHWPDTVVRMRFRDSRRPGLLLRHDLRVFDDVGRPEAHELSFTNFEENVLTDHIRPAGDAIDGVLDV